MTIQSAMKQGYTILTSAEVETPHLDSTVLLAHALKTTKEKLYASLPDRISDADLAVFKALIEKRCNGIPVSYIRNRKEFYGLEFYVDRRVLVTRPDTEIVVDTLLSILDENPDFQEVHDLCTGSGCIAISLKHLKPLLAVTASDISPEAGEVFKLNSSHILHTELPFYCSDLFDKINGPFDIIVSNPPYLTDKEVDSMKRLAWPEPVLALYGGKAGVAVTRRLIKQAPGHLHPGGFVVLESAPAIMDELKKIMESSGFIDIVIIKDLGGRNRVIAGRKPWVK